VPDSPYRVPPAVRPSVGRPQWHRLAIAVALMLAAQMAVVGAIWLWKQAVRFVNEVGEEIGEADGRTVDWQVRHCGLLPDGGSRGCGPCDCPEPTSVPTAPRR
jgi:hypothetical protein